MSDPIYKGATKIGNGRGPVVIETSGKVVIKVKEKYFPLNFQDATEESQSESQVEIKQNIKIIPQSDLQEVISTLTEDTIIVTQEGQLFLFSSGKLISLQASIPSDLSINNLTVANKLTMGNNSEVLNLNANYLQGNSASSFGHVNKDTTIKSRWNFQSPVTFSALEGPETYIGNDGVWRGKTLYIDNIIFNSSDENEEDSIVNTQINVLQTTVGQLQTASFGETDPATVTIPLLNQVNELQDAVFGANDVLSLQDQITALRSEIEKLTTEVNNLKNIVDNLQS